MITKQLNYVKILIYSLLIMVFAITYDYLINHYYIPFYPFRFIYIDMDESSLTSFLFTVWQVQTALSLLSLTLVTIILVKLESRVLGMSMTDILLIKKDNLWLNYWEMIFVSIVIIIANLYFVSHEMLSGATLLFLLSGVTILILLVESLKVIMNPEAQYQKVLKFLEKGINQSLSEEDK
jgi:hypothetical protein